MQLVAVVEVKQVLLLVAHRFWAQVLVLLVAQDLMQMLVAVAVVLPLLVQTQQTLLAVLAVLVLMSTLSLVQGHCSKVVAVAAAVHLQAAQVVHQWAVQVARQQVLRLQQTPHQAAAAVQATTLAVQAVQPLSM